MSPALRLTALTVFWSGVVCGAADRDLASLDNEQGTLTIQVPTRDGIVRLGDRIAVDDAIPDEGAVAQVADALEAVDGFNLRSKGTQLRLRALSAAIPDVEIRILESDSDAPTLKVRVDLRDMQRRIPKVKKRIRSEFDRDDSRFGLTLPAVTGDRPVVVLVHGYGSHTGKMTKARQAIQSAGYACATFDYPNDAPVTEAAELFTKELKLFQKEHVGTSVIVVAHSMGGLVSRSALERPGSQIRCVTRLIMVATPNSGSCLAWLPGGLDPVQIVRNRQDLSLKDSFRLTITDGLNEARHDLQPHSQFLHTLNSGRRNSDIEYSIIMGTEGPATAEEVQQWKERLEKALGDTQGGQIAIAAVDAVFGEFEELTRDKGDGIVSIRSARLDGVEDVVLIPVGHRDIKDSAADENRNRIVAEIVRRLK